MFEALFILTTVDAGTRVGRFMLQDTLGNVWKPHRPASTGSRASGLTSAIVVGGVGLLPLRRRHRPARRDQPALPALRHRQPAPRRHRAHRLHHRAVKCGRLRWAWVTGIPLAWDVAVTLTASWQKVFSADPRIGFFAQRERYADALDAGEVLPPAKNLDQMQTVVTNSTVDGVLIAAVLDSWSSIVIVNAAVVCVARRTLPRPAADDRDAVRRVPHRPPGAVRRTAGGSPDRASGDAARAVRWYLRELTGEAEYDRYCERHLRHHPLAPVPTPREYQALRARHREDHPQSRCC